jgi:hypothetical protein
MQQQKILKDFFFDRSTPPAHTQLIMIGRDFVYGVCRLLKPIAALVATWGLLFVCRSPQTINSGPMATELEPPANTSGGGQHMHFPRACIPYHMSR